MVAFKALITPVPIYFPAELLNILPVMPHYSHTFLQFPKTPHMYTLHALSFSEIINKQINEITHHTPEHPLLARYSVGNLLYITIYSSQQPYEVLFSQSYTWESWGTEKFLRTFTNIKFHCLVREGHGTCFPWQNPNLALRTSALKSSSLPKQPITCPWGLLQSFAHQTFFKWAPTYTSQCLPHYTRSCLKAAIVT